MDVHMVWLVALAVTSAMFASRANPTFRAVRVEPPAIQARPYAGRGYQGLAFRVSAGGRVHDDANPMLRREHILGYLGLL